MAIPTYVGAGTGIVITTTSGTSTVSKTSCTAGNVIALHVMRDGNTDGNPTLSSISNISALDGTGSSLTTPADGGSYGGGSGGSVFGHIFRCGRVTSNGTCSVDVTAAGTDDVFARLYEFSGVYVQGTTFEQIAENTYGLLGQVVDTSTVPQHSNLVTTGDDRLGVCLVAIGNPETPSSFTGESNGDFTEPSGGAYVESGGTGATLQVQTTDVASATTVSGGSFTITSAPWATLTWAFLPAVAVPTVRTVRSSLRWG